MKMATPAEENPAHDLAVSKTAVIVNRHSGTVRSKGEETVRALIEETFGSAGGADIRFLDGEQIDTAVKELLKGGKVDRIIVGGGDGTVASVAALLAGSGAAMGILPLGTMNMMAKTIGLSGDLGEALAQLLAAEVKVIDAGRAGDRLFLHHIAFGIQPKLVKIRERLGYSSRLTKMLANVRAFLAVITRPQSQRLSLQVDGQAMNVTTPALIISNNLYRDAMMLTQARLDEGILGIYAVAPMSLWSFIGLAFDLLRGRWLENLNVTVEHGRSVTLALHRPFGRKARSIKGTLDGELILFDLPLVVFSNPGVLKMLVPQPPTT